MYAAFYQILETGDELKQLQKSDFYIDGPTVYAGVVLDDSRILQVFETGLRVLSPGLTSNKQHLKVCLNLSQ
jgi:hypothetical protein